MKSRFIVTPILCTGCRTCELACSFTHAKDGKVGRSRIYPLDARIQRPLCAGGLPAMRRPGLRQVMSGGCDSLQ